MEIRTPSEIAMETVLSVQDYTILASQAVANVFRKPRYLADTLLQADSIGVGSLPVVVLAGMSIGAVLALQSSNTLQRFGSLSLTGQLVSLSMVRELGAVISGLMVAGRNASGIASELGTMKVTEQIDALRALATNPVRKLVVPRVLATTVMMPLLTLLACFIGIIGGLIIAVGSLHLTSNFYIRSVIEAVKYNDLASGVGKTFFFGFAIGLIACYNGLSTTGGADGVGRSTTATVVTASITVLILDFFLTKLFLFLF